MAAKSKKQAAAALPVVEASKPSERYRFEIILIPSIRTGKNIRKDFNEEGMDALTENIRLNGIQNPLLVMEDDTPDEFTLISGERRLRAAQRLDMHAVPCRIYSKLTDQELYNLMISENLLRQDLNPIEEAEGLRKILDAGMSQEDLGERIGKSQAWISDRISLLDASAELQEAIITRVITPTHARALLSMKNYSFFDQYVQFFFEKNRERIEDGYQGYTTVLINS